MAVALALAFSVVAAAPATATTGTIDTGDIDQWFTATVSVKDAVVVGKKSKKLVIDVYYEASNDFILSYDNYITLETAGGLGFDMFDLVDVSDDHQRVVLTVPPAVYTDRWYVGLSASANIWDDYWGDYEGVEYLYDDRVASFTTKRNVILKTNATPEPVKKGTKVTVKGTADALAFTVAGKPYYKDFANKTLRVYFNPTGPKPEKYMGSVRTDKKGAYSRKFTQKVSGTWRVAFAATKTYAAASAKDAVKVR
jgi:hypothetical protein